MDTSILSFSLSSSATLEASLLSSYMEGLELDQLSSPSPESDIGSELLTRYQNSPNEHHQRICAAVGAMAQALQDQGVPRTPVAYFAATVSSLDRLSRSEPSDPVLPALLSFLSVLLPRVSKSVIRSTFDSLSGFLISALVSGGSMSVAGLKAGLKCASGVILAGGEEGSWKKLEGLYGVILRFAIYDQPKVRKQSHSCLRDVLQSVRGTPVLALASEEITKKFERSLLLAGRSKSSSSTLKDTEEASTGAKEVLYILHAFKDCLPLMSVKDTASILKYCKSLLDLRQRIVTRTIMEITLSVCCSPTSEVSSEPLLDVLCSLALSVAEIENLADEMTITARLLHIGTKKVYDLDRQKCIVKLPLIFNTLGDILASEHVEARFAATEALKGLIPSCVDEGLIKQGVEQVKLNLKGGIRKSGPTIIERICATMEGFLGYRYNAVWGMSFQVLSVAFHQLEESSSTLMVGTVRSLAGFHNLSDEGLSYGKQLHECVGSALSAMGPEMFLSLLPLNLDVEDGSDSNAWLLPILKQYVAGARLSYFFRNILDMARLLQRKSHELEKEGRMFSARSAEGLVYSLWSLLPAFCNYAIDTSTSFKDLQKVMCKTLAQEPNLHGIICSSLQILIRQNKNIRDSIMPDDELTSQERKARESYTPEVAEENLKAIRSCSSKLFYALSEIFLRSSKDSGGCLLSSIHDLASISEKKVVKQWFKKFNELLEETSKEKQPELSSAMQIDNASDEASLSRARSFRMALLLDLEVSLLPGLDKEDVDVLFNAIKPLFQDKEELMQKKANKTLSIMIKECDEFLAEKVDELILLMIEATGSCNSKAKHYRLDCIYSLILHVSKDMSGQRKRDCLSAFLTEIILALKEGKKKTRNMAYEFLVKIGHACQDEEQGGETKNLKQLFYMIAGGLAGENEHMISAAVTGLARLAYEFSDLINEAYRLLPSSLLLLKRESREIVKANLGLIKVLVAKSKADGLQMHLKMMVEGLLKWQNETTNHFKAKVKLLLEMLVRKCGLDAIKAVMPEEHMKLLTNIRKIKERKERKAKSMEDAESLHTKTSISRHSRWNHSRSFSVFGSDDDDDDSNVEKDPAATLSGIRSKASLPVSRASLRSKRKLQASSSFPEDLDQMEDDPLDLLDRQRTRAALQSSSHLKRKPRSHDELEIDPEGRLIVREDGTLVSSKAKTTLSSDHDEETRSRQSGSHRSAKTTLTREHKKRQKTSDSAWSYTGSEYTSGKAGGDLKKKDKLDPYAYWPLDRKLLNRREERKSVARKGMASVMKFARRFEGKSVSTALSVKGLNAKSKLKGKGKKKKSK